MMKQTSNIANNNIRTYITTKRHYRINLVDEIRLKINNEIIKNATSPQNITQRILIK